MRSEIRIFSEKGINAQGNILPFSDFKLLSDLDCPVMDREMAEIIIKKAEQYLDKPITYIPLSLYRNFFLTGVRSKHNGPAYERRDILYYLAMAEIIERKGRFTEKLADFVWAYLEQTEWCLPEHYWYSPDAPKSTVPTVYKESMVPTLELFSGSICSVLSLIAYYLKDELDAISSVIVKRIKHEVFNRGVRPFLTVKFAYLGTEFANNWLTNVTQNILFTTALTVEDLQTRERVVDLAMEYLDNFTAKYPPDGSCDEGPGYWDAAPANLFDALEILEDMSGGRIAVYDHPHIKKMGEFIVDYNIHANHFICFADCNPFLDVDGKMLARYGRKANSQDLLSFGTFTAASSSADVYYYCGMAYRNLKNLYTARPDPCERKDAKPAVWYGDNMIAIFRENENTGKGLFMATKGGTNLEAHNHLDVGCLVVYSNGKPVIIDPSYGSYNNMQDRYCRWFYKSAYHSVPSVDGVEQGAGRRFASRSEECDLENKTVTMDLAAAFPDDAGILKMQRTCHMGDGFISVTDEVVADHEADISFNYLMIDEPVVIDESTLKISDGRTFLIDGEGFKLEIERVENKHLPYEDLPFKYRWQRECLWRIVIKTRAVSKKITVKIF